MTRPGASRFAWTWWLVLIGALPCTASGTAQKATHRSSQAHSQPAPEPEAAPELPSQSVTFGVIELASSSVKGLTFAFQPGMDTDDAEEPPEADRTDRLQYAERNASFISMRDGCKLSDRGLSLLVRDATEVVGELREGAQAKSLSAPKLFVVGSSGLGGVCNTDEIVARMYAATGLCTEFISAPEEARLSLGFVLPKDRYSSLIINVGGGNTLGGYYVMTRGAAFPPREWHGFDMKYGSRTLKDKALALMAAERKDAAGRPLPALDYWHAVDEVLRQDVRPELDRIKEEHVGLQSFVQLYMQGGAIWGVSTRVKPVQQEEWAISPLSLNDFDAVLTKLRDGTYNEFDEGQFGPKVSSKTREAADAELRSVLQRFDPQSLYAGVALARFVVQETTPFARVYFPTTASWISGYAREKFAAAGAVIQTCQVGGRTMQGTGVKP